MPVNPLIPATTNLPIPNQLAPMGVVLIDPVSGNQLSTSTGIPVSVSGTSTVVQGNYAGAVTATPMPVAPAANYTAITTAGTTTVKASAGIFYGATLIALGTIPTIGASDGATVIMPTFSGTAVLQYPTPGPIGIGVKFATSLVVVTTGTAATWNVLWD